MKGCKRLVEKMFGNKNGKGGHVEGGRTEGGAAGWVGKIKGKKEAKEHLKIATTGKSGRPNAARSEDP